MISYLSQICLLLINWCTFILFLNLFSRMYISNVWLQVIYFYFVMKENGLHVKIWNFSWAKGFLDKVDLIWVLRFFGSRPRIQISMWSPFCGYKSKANHLLKRVMSIFIIILFITDMYSNFFSMLCLVYIFCMGFPGARRVYFSITILNKSWIEQPTTCTK